MTSLQPPHTHPVHTRTWIPPQTWFMMTAAEATTQSDQVQTKAHFGTVLIHFGWWVCGKSDCQAISVCVWGRDLLTFHISPSNPGSCLWRPSRITSICHWPPGRCWVRGDRHYCIGLKEMNAILFITDGTCMLWSTLWVDRWMNGWVEGRMDG